MSRLGLKKLLNETIQRRGYVALDELNAMCDELDYKRGTMDRRLRQSDSPNLEPVLSPKKAIIGYRWVNTQLPLSNASNSVPDAPSEAPRLFELPPNYQYH